MTIYENILRLTSYALNNSLITKEDIIYTQNKLLELFRLDGFETPVAPELPQVKTEDLEEILKEMLDYADQNGIFEDSGIVSRDLFDTKIMGQLLPPPSDVIDIFKTLYDEESPKAATSWYYKFSCDTDYIRRYRVCKDLKWKTNTEYGDLDICLGATKNDRILDKSPKFAEDTGNLLTYLYSPQHWIPEGRKVRINIDYKKYTKADMLKLYKERGGDITKLKDESFSCYDPIDNEECMCRNGICKPCFRKYVAYKLNGALYKPENDISVCEAIKAEILPQIEAGTYGRPEEEKEILEVLEIYKKEYPENIGKCLYKNINNRKQ